MLSTGVRISSHALKSMGVGLEEVVLFKEPLNEACAAFEINTPGRVAAFLAQAAHESSKFKQMQENLFYTTPERLMKVFPSRIKTLEDAKTLTKNPRGLANRVYSGRLGNGSIESEDGWNFRGRGLFQLTGRANYQEAAKGLNRPYVEKPDLVGFPIDAAMTAAWFWKSKGCNQLADSHQFSVITQRINGPAMLGHEERMAMYSAVINGLN